MRASSHEGQSSWGWLAGQKCRQVPAGVGRGPGVGTLATTSEKGKERRVGRGGGEREGGGSAKEQGRMERGRQDGGRGDAPGWEKPGVRSAGLGLKVV